MSKKRSYIRKKKKNIKSSLSYNSLARLDESLRNNNNKKQEKIINELKNEKFVTYDELENEINKLREEIQKLKQQIDLERLEQKLPYFALIQKFLLIYNLYQYLLEIKKEKYYDVIYNYINKKLIKIRTRKKKIKSPSKSHKKIYNLVTDDDDDDNEDDINNNDNDEEKYDDPDIDEFEEIDIDEKKMNQLYQEKKNKIFDKYIEKYNLSMKLSMIAYQISVMQEKRRDLVLRSIGLFDAATNKSTPIYMKIDQIKIFLKHRGMTDEEIQIAYNCSNASFVKNKILKLQQNEEISFNDEPSLSNAFNYDYNKNTKSNKNNKYNKLLNIQKQKNKKNKKNKKKKIYVKIFLIFLLLFLLFISIQFIMAQLLH